MSDHHHSHDHDHDHGDHTHTHGHDHTHTHTHGKDTHSHPHTHVHTHTHGENAHKEKEHGHAHGASHDHEHPAEMDISKKLQVLANHWLSHNIDHAKTYENWALQARESGLGDVADTLDEISRQTESINALFEKIKTQL